MSQNLPNHFIQQYSTNVQLLLQQKGSKLRDIVTSGSHVGKQASPVDQIGAIKAQRVVGRFQPMGRIDASLERRWVNPTDYDLPQLIDSYDLLRLITDPKSAYVTNAVYALGREIDNEIITAFFGPAKIGESGATIKNFPAGNQIPVNHGGTASGLTVAKLREAKKRLLAAEVDVEHDPIYAVITSKQSDDLLSQTQIISTDFNNKPVLVEGKVTSFLGINFICCELLGVDNNGDRRIPVFAKSGVYLGIWNDIKTSVNQRYDLQSVPWQVHCTGTFGATRLEEKKIIEIKCEE